MGGSVFEYVKNSWLNYYNFRLPECEGGVIPMLLSRVAMTTNRVSMVTSCVSMVTTAALVLIEQVSHYHCKLRE